MQLGSIETSFLRYVKANRRCESKSVVATYGMLYGNQFIAAGFTLVHSLARMKPINSDLLELSFKLPGT